MNSENRQGIESDIHRLKLSPNTYYTPSTKIGPLGETRVLFAKNSFLLVSVLKMKFGDVSYIGEKKY